MRIHLRAGVVIAALALTGATGASAAGPAPVVSIKDMAQLPTPLPYPYDEKANPDADVAAAFARAKQSGKRVFIDFGGNWCTDCRILAGIMELPEIKAFVAQHYEVVNVFVGRMNHNLWIPQRFGLDKLVGVPTIIIADADGKPLNTTNAAELADARHMTPQGIADWLAQWAAQ